MTSKYGKKEDVNNVEFNIVGSWRLNVEFFIRNIWLIMFAIFFFNMLYSHRGIASYNVLNYISTIVIMHKFYEKKLLLLDSVINSNKIFLKQKMPSRR